ncbi:FmdB family zinc ribbon protein [Actinocrinis sp.]|uniref:FmdB family zinc ribbon protein n=1 Tax=Actinocrinis sp. TaxID=1920516 RepID=UPI0032C22DA5
MPTYQYQCTECGEGLEAVQKFSDDPLTICPNCQGTLRKVYSAVGIVFKGSGFYRTDSRSSSASNGKNSSGGGSKDSAPSSSSSSSTTSSSDSSSSGSSAKSGSGSSSPSAAA